MFALVKFDDGLLEIHPMKNVKAQDENNCIVKFKGCNYRAHLLASNETRGHLEHIIDAANPTQSSSRIKLKQLSNPKSKEIRNDEVPITRRKKPQRKSSLTPNHENQLKDISLHKSDNIAGPVKYILQEHSSLDKSIDRHDAGDVAHTVIKKSGEITTTEQGLDTSQIISSSHMSEQIGYENGHSSLDESIDRHNAGDVTHTIIQESSEITTTEQGVDTSQIISSSHMSEQIGYENEHSSLDESIDRHNTCNVTHTIIPESSEITTTDEEVGMSQIISSSRISEQIGDKYPIVLLNRYENQATNASPLNISDLLLPNQSILQDSDLNSSNYPFNTLLCDGDALFSSENVLTSTPDNLIQDDTGNLNRNNNQLMVTFAKENSNEDNNNSQDILTEDGTGISNKNINNLMNTTITNNTGKLNGNDNNFIDKKTKSSIKARRLSEDSDTSTEESIDSEHEDPNYEPPEKSASNSGPDAGSDYDEIGNNSQNENSPENGHDTTDRLDVSVAKTLPGSTRCNDEDLNVEKSRGRNGDNKYNFCLYCHKKQKKIARHLELKHTAEEDVKKFVVLPKNSSERKKIIAVIRKQGNFLYNTQTEYNDGELIVSRRPNTKFTRAASDFRACAICKAFFSKNSLRMHFAKCAGRQSKKNRVVMVMSKQVMARIHSRASETVMKLIFPPLREDHVVRAIRYDELVIVYANKMGEKYQEARDYEMIRQRIRLLGRFLITMRKLNMEVTDFTSIFDPKFCDDAIKAITIEAKLTSSSQGPVTPAVASSLGTLLKLLGSILITESIKKHDDIKKKNTKDFLKLLTQELALNINRRVMEHQTQQYRKKKVDLPSMEDVKKLCTYLEAKRNAAFQKLNCNFSELAWLHLAETTLTSLQLFNRRRAGEIERTLIEDFKNYQSLDENTDKNLFNALSKEGQSLANRYVRFVIRGKLNRTVPVLLSTELLQCIKLLLSHRINMKISDSNPYVFGLKGEIKSKHKHLRACALLRKFSTESGATHPERLRGTKLRKHIATMCVSLNLTEHQITDLANYMGHAEKIHKDIYRQPIINREILGISKLLEVAQGINEEDDDDDDNDSDDESEQPQYDNHENSNHFRKGNIQLQNSSSDVSKIYKTPCQKNVPSAAKKLRFSSPYGSVKRTPWNAAEKRKVLELFGGCLQNKKLPSLKEIPGCPAILEVLEVLEISLHSIPP